jgi:hypothetical protein
MLRSVPDIVWERGHGKHGPTGEGGYFEYSAHPVTRHLTLYDGAFESDEVLVELLAHEFGHAVSYKPPSAGAGGALATSAEFQEALRLDGGKAITDYAKKDAHEHYAEAYSLFISEPDTLKLLRPKVYAYFLKQQTAAAAPPP